EKARGRQGHRIRVFAAAHSEGDDRVVGDHRRDLVINRQIVSARQRLNAYEVSSHKYLVQDETLMVVLPAYLIRLEFPARRSVLEATSMKPVLLQSELAKKSQGKISQLACGSNASGDFLITYDDAESVRELANRHGFDTDLVPMKNAHHAEMMELLIGR